MDYFWVLVLIGGSTALFAIGALVYDRIIKRSKTEN